LRLCDAFALALEHHLAFELAKALGIARASVYRALEAA
jgi:hypothetical protein